MSSKGEVMRSRRSPIHSRTHRTRGATIVRARAAGGRGLRTSTGVIAGEVGSLRKSVGRWLVATFGSAASR